MGHLIGARSSGSVMTERLILASDAGRVARLMATDDIAEEATAGWVSTHPVPPHGVHMVSSRADLAPAVRRLAATLRFEREDPIVNGSEVRPGLRCARVISPGPGRLHAERACAAAAPGDHRLASSFGSRVRRYRELHSVTTRMIDVEPRRPVVP